MKTTWDTLRFVLLTGGIVITLAIFGGGKQAEAAVIAAVVVVLLLVCSLMAWRNDVYERETKRHTDTLRLLHGIYKAIACED